MSESFTVASRLNMTSNVPEVIAQLMRAFGQANNEIKEAQERLAAFATEMREMASSSRGIGALVATMKEMSGIRVGAAAIEDVQRMSTLTRELTEQQEQLAAATRQTAGAWRQMAQAGAGIAHGAAIGPGGIGGGPGYGTAYGNRGGAWPPGTAAWAGGPNAPGGGGGGVPPGTPGPASPGGRSRRAPAHVDWWGMAYAAQTSGNAGTSFLERSLNAEMEVEQQLAQFRMNTGVKDADIQRIRARAEALAHSIPGTTIAENLHTILDAYTVTGNLGEAMAGSEGMAKLRYLLANLPGQHRGDQAFAAAQAVEVMQRFYDPKTHQVNIDAMNQQIGAMAQVAAGTGGRADPGMYLGFAKQARIGGMVANDQFLYRDLPAMLIALGGSRAGTGEASTFMQFITGTMTKNAANALKSAGLLDQNATWKGGRVQGMAQHFHGQDVFAQNPVEWVRQYILDPTNGVLARNHVDPNDRLAMDRFLSSWNARQTGLGFMAEITLGMGGINKEGGKIAQTTANPLGVVQQFDPYQKLREFNAAENELLVTLGQGAIGPALEALKGLTSVLRDLITAAKEYPSVARDIMLVGGGLAVLAKGAGEVGMALVIGGPVLTGIFALSRAAQSLPGPLGAAATGIGGLLGPLGGLIALAGGAAAIRGGLSLLENKRDSILYGPQGTATRDAVDQMTSHSIFDWKSWNGTYAAQDRDALLRARSPTQSPGEMVNPPSQSATVQLRGDVHMDGSKVGDVTAKGMMRPGSGTSGGDMRADPWSLGLGSIP